MTKARKLPRKASSMISMSPRPSAIEDFARQAERMLQRADKLMTEVDAYLKDKAVRKRAKGQR